MTAFTYEKYMSIGRQSGCHQLKERSFSINGKQFPICARCTGVLIGNIVAFVTFLIYTLPIQFYISGCGIMYIDWLVQYLGIHESTNLRRLITGIIGGYALTTLYCSAIRYTIRLLLEL